jgi:TrmH family RNA methyltransferase
MSVDGSGTAVPPLSVGGLRSARQLVRRRGREVADAFLVEGPQSVREALATPGEAVRVIVGEGALGRPVVWQLAEAARERGIDVASVSEAGLAQLADTVHAQGIVAVCHRRRPGLDSLGQSRLVLVCDQVRDPGNLGTMVRAADAFGADAVLLSSGCVELWNPKVVRATTGSLFHVPVVVDVPFADAVSWLRRRGMSVVAADAGGTPLHALATRGGLVGPVAWVVGNEAWGFDASDLSLCDATVSVPMWGRAESLNAATAIAVCLYQTAVCQNPQ